MIKSDLQLMINQYFDGCLDKNKEPVLFTQLSQNEEGRDYFKKLSSIQSVINDTTEDFPDYLEERILYSLDNSGQKRFHMFFNKNIFAFVSYSVALILLFLSIFFYSQVLSYRERYETKVQQVNQQGEIMKLLFNSLPVTEVKSALDNEIIVRAKM
ncbi:MAG: hypothetical protein A2V66_11330 [Ignavibacteria bacterium RBG_13_36_8]|nr:MAG: hypothetical protein A2V66_11330 [Ignavibacteria bacterium RBG_13_36_8]